MNKEVRKVKLISKNVLEFLEYYSRFNLLYFDRTYEKADDVSSAF